MTISQASPPPLPSKKAKLPVWAHLLCGWPLVMVFVGGAIGGGLGGLAYGLNAGIYRSGLPLAAKIALNLLIGCSAIVLWMVIAAAIATRFGS